MNKDKVERIIKEITDKCKDDDYIFRGACEIYDDCTEKSEKIISSTLYRKYRESNQLWNTDIEGLTYVEEDIVKRARDSLNEYRKHTNIEILTELRHYGYSVLLIDFSLDMYISLLFACNGKFEEDGELIMLKKTEPMVINDINYTLIHDTRPALGLVIPIPTEASKDRVQNQKSIFVHASSGYIDKGLCKLKTIKRKDKRDILEYLRKYHGITENIIYNDLAGFISNEDNGHEARIQAYKGDLLIRKKVC